MIKSFVQYNAIKNNCGYCHNHYFKTADGQIQGQEKGGQTNVRDIGGERERERDRKGGKRPQIEGETQRENGRNRTKRQKGENLMEETLDVETEGETQSCEETAQRVIQKMQNRGEEINTSRAGKGHKKDKGKNREGVRGTKGKIEEKTQRGEALRSYDERLRGREKIRKETEAGLLLLSADVCTCITVRKRYFPRLYHEHGIPFLPQYTNIYSSCTRTFSPFN